MSIPRQPAIDASYYLHDQSIRIIGPQIALADFSQLRPDIIQESVRDWAVAAFAKSHDLLCCELLSFRSSNPSAVKTAHDRLVLIFFNRQETKSENWSGKNVRKRALKKYSFSPTAIARVFPSLRSTTLFVLPFSLSSSRRRRRRRRRARHCRLSLLLLLLHLLSLLLLLPPLRFSRFFFLLFDRFPKLKSRYISIQISNFHFFSAPVIFEMK